MAMGSLLETVFITGATCGGNARPARRRYTERMKSVQLSELGAVADDVRKGETVEVRDGETVVAKLTPVRQPTIEERIDELARQGKVTKGTGTLPDWFFTEPLPDFGGSVLEQLLNDRKSRDW
jgi:antitoxin (DNA-binding transcriptional repressor) of toxin-antitoxin stability system